MRFLSFTCEDSFRNQSENGFVLPDRTCVILEGEIVNEYVSDNQNRLN